VARERGILVDQSTIYRWVQRFLPLFERRHESTASRWARLARCETYARIRAIGITFIAP